MYLGCAVIMLFELVELIIDLIIATCRSSKKNRIENMDQKIDNVEKGTKSISFYEAEFDKFVLLQH